MKNYVPFPPSLKSIAHFSFFGVRYLKAVEGIFMFFPTKICFFSIWWKEEHQQLITYHKLIELFLVYFFLNFRNSCHFWSCFISHSFVGICDIYLENSLSNFYFSFDIEKKTIPVYIPTLLVMSFILNHQSYTKCSRVSICFILSFQKIVSHTVCCEKLIFYLNWNHQQICKGCSQTQNTHLLYRKLLPISRYNPPPPR